MKRCMLTMACLAVAGMAVAKLPPPDEATKAKAAEAAAKTAWQGKVDAYKLCQAQDRVAAKYKSSHPAQARPAAGGASAVPVAVAPAASAAPGAPAATTTAAASAAPASAKPPMPTAATASQGGGTPVAAVAAAAPSIPSCADPGVFAYTPPEQKPLETSGAHSPAATAASPPSVRTPSAEMAPAKPSTGPATK